MQYRNLSVAGCAALIFGLFACSGEDGHDGVNGVNGLNGKDGTSCKVSALKDGSGYKVLCGGDSVGVLLNGKNGAKGAAGATGAKGETGKTGAKGDKGDRGEACSVAALPDNSGYDVYCGATKVGVIKNGTNGQDCATQAADDGILINCSGTITKLLNGKDGKNCSATTVTKDGRNGIEMSCDGEVVGTVWDGKDAAAGSSNCTTTDKGNGVYELTCGDAEPMTMYKAVCGIDPYDPVDKFCVLGKIYDKCNGGAYTVNTEYCDNGKVVPLCAEIKRNKDGSVDLVDNKVQFVKSRATKDGEFCWNGIITPKCGGKEFGKQEFCGKAFDGKTDSIYAYCGGAANLTSLETAYSKIGMSLSSSSVSNSSSSSSEGLFGNLIAITGAGNIDEESYGSFYKALTTLQNSCLDDVTPLKCGSVSYDGAKQFCDERDDHVYKYAKIGDLYWMTENLAFEYKLPKKVLESVTGENPDADTTWSLDVIMGKVKYENEAFENYEATEGRFYTWNAAVGDGDLRKVLSREFVEGTTVDKLSVLGLKPVDNQFGACPVGWWLPEKEDLEDLAELAELSKGSFAGLVVNIIDEEEVTVDFNVNFLGFYGEASTEEAYFWSGTAVDGSNDKQAYGMVIDDLGKGTVAANNRKYAFSIRCVTDMDPNPDSH